MGGGMGSFGGLDLGFFVFVFVLDVSCLVWLYGLSSRGKAREERSANVWKLSTYVLSQGGCLDGFLQRSLHPS